MCVLFFLFFWSIAFDRERDKLFELNEEFKFTQLNNGAMMPQEGSPSTTVVDTLDMIPPDIK